MYLEEKSKVKQLEIELKAMKDIINLKEMLRGSKQTENLKDIAAQTDVILKNSNFCQTNHIVKKDFEIQVNLVNRSVFNQMGIKKEPQIAMPNRASSNAESSPKKRKTPSVDLRAKIAKVTGDNVSILNPDLFRTYKSHCSDPIMAQEAIRKMKNCSSVQIIRANDSMSDENIPPENLLKIQEEVKNAVRWLLKRYSEIYSLNEFNITTWKSFHQSFGDYILWHEENKPTTDLIAINLFTISGIETWLVQDFEKGPKESKWFRGRSISEFQHALHLAMLKFANIKIADVDQTKNRLIDAHEIRHLTKEILKGKTLTQEKKTGDEIEVTVTIKIGLDLFIGKSKTSGVPKAERSREQGMKMTKQKAHLEARKEAEKKFFNAFFGVDGIREFTVDEMGRPVESFNLK